MNETQQQHERAKRVKPKYRSGAGADHVDAAPTTATTQHSVDAEVYIVDASRRRDSALLIIKNKQNTLGKGHRVERADRQLLRHPRVKKGGWVDGRFLRSKEAVEGDERQEEVQRRAAVAAEAERQRRVQMERDNQQVRRGFLDPRTLARRAWNSTKRIFGPDG